MESSLQNALQYIKQAVHEDEFGNYSEAIKLYNLGIELCKQAQEEETAPEVLQVLPGKISEYTQRVRALELALIHMYSPPMTTPEAQAPRTQKKPVDDFEMHPEVKSVLLKEVEENLRNEVAKEKEGETLFRTGRRGETSLEKAIAATVKAKKKDMAREYFDAFTLYMLALDYYHDAAKNAPHGILPQLNKTMAIYLERAEKIKEVLDKYELVSRVVKEQAAIEETNTEYHQRMSVEKGIDGRIGPLKKTIRTSFWNDSSPFTIQATIKKNIFKRRQTIEITIFLDNRGTITVDSIQVHLLQMITHTTVSASNAKKTAKTTNNVIDPMWFREGRQFPKGHGTFKGLLRYNISDSLEVTDCDNSGSYAREYKLIVQAVVPHHNNVAIPFDLRLIE